MRAENLSPSAPAHPSIKRYLERAQNPLGHENMQPKMLDANWLRQLCLDAGADDVGFVHLDAEAISGQRERIVKLFPSTRSVISIVGRMNRESVLTPARSVSNLEFHHTTEGLNEIARDIVISLRDKGVRALNPSAGFPMEMDRFPDEEIWTVGHKPVAVAAGLGQMGLHRNVIHPKFGNHIILDTILIDADITAYNQPIDYNPCFSCKLCVAACPVGAIGADGYFNFSACFTHNYREFMGGFNDWVQQIAESSSGADYRQRVKTNETASMWQSLSFGPNYKAAYCMAVCPAGDDIIGQYLADKKGYLENVVQPLQKKQETIYVVAKTDAEKYVAKRFPHKKVKRIGSGLTPTSIRGFLRGLRLIFQPGKAEDINLRYHFHFTGSESIDATVVVAEKRVNVLQGHHGKADLSVQADATTWLKFLSSKKSLPWALVTRKIRLQGSPKHLLTFGECFVS